MDILGIAVALLAAAVCFVEARVALSPVRSGRDLDAAALLLAVVTGLLAAAALAGPNQAARVFFGASAAVVLLALFAAVAYPRLASGNESLLPGPQGSEPSGQSERAPPTADALAADPTVAACQCAVRDGGVDANVAAVRDRIAALPADVDLAVFPEYALTGFPADADAVADAALAAGGSTVGSVAEAAAENDVGVVVGFVEDGGSGTLHNAVCYLGPDGERERYRKRHLWGDEADVLTAGTERAVVETPAGSAGLLTCYDLNFVGESAALTDAGVDCLLVAGAWPAEHAANWDLLLRARALDGVRWAVGCGRTGRGADGREYAGRSAVVRPDGAVHDRLDRAERDLVATLENDVLAEQRDLVDIGGA